MPVFMKRQLVDIGITDDTVDLGLGQGLGLPEVDIGVGDVDIGVGGSTDPPPADPPADPPVDPPVDPPTSPPADPPASPTADPAPTTTDEPIIDIQATLPIIPPIGVTIDLPGGNNNGGGNGGGLGGVVDPITSILPSILPLPVPQPGESPPPSPNPTPDPTPVQPSIPGLPNQPDVNLGIPDPTITIPAGLAQGTSAIDSDGSGGLLPPDIILGGDGVIINTAGFGDPNIPGFKSESYSQIVTKINGKPTTLYSPLPTGLYKPSAISSKRAGMIAGLTMGGIITFVMALTCLFWYRRRRQRREREAMEAANQAAGGLNGSGPFMVGRRRALLDGEEGLEDDPDPFADQHAVRDMVQVNHMGGGGGGGLVVPEELGGRSSYQALYDPFASPEGPPVITYQTTAAGAGIAAVASARVASPSLTPSITTSSSHGTKKTRPSSLLNPPQSPTVQETPPALPTFNFKTGRPLSTSTSATRTTTATTTRPGTSGSATRPGTSGSAATTGTIPSFGYTGTSGSGGAGDGDLLGLDDDPFRPSHEALAKAYGGDYAYGYGSGNEGAGLAFPAGAIPSAGVSVTGKQKKKKQVLRVNGSTSDSEPEFDRYTDEPVGVAVSTEEDDPFQDARSHFSTVSSSQLEHDPPSASSHSHQHYPASNDGHSISDLQQQYYAYSSYADDDTYGGVEMGSSQKRTLAVVNPEPESPVMNRGGISLR